ncbi:scavenger receptor cysteine-rich type 1 M130-like protein [Labeo rohita]|uniref:Scavenger receptor cysteine-rich type 1 M130-like protein n=1 Tax=Labeo rohita TaxID=84645 RepID=A0A498P355_LABRO|nr:scavenger receptor cysteine-rich type 1 M130-like protein [Labeo rohita]
MPQICNILSWLTVFSKLFFEHFKIIHIIIKVHGIKYLYGVISRHVKKCRTFYLVTLFCNARCNEIQIKLLNPRSPVFRQISFKIQTVRRVRQHILTRRAPPSVFSKLFFEHFKIIHIIIKVHGIKYLYGVISRHVKKCRTFYLVTLFCNARCNEIQIKLLNPRSPVFRQISFKIQTVRRVRQHILTRRAPPSGSLISEELHSEYEVADDLLSAKEFKKFKTAYYDDVTSGSGLKEEMVKEITPGYYDDVITDGLKPDRETEGVQEEYDDVTSVSEDVRNLLVSSLAVHDGLVRLSGERQCEGEVEVFIHQVWSRVLLDSWSLTESSVVCRQLGCGSVLNFYGSSSSSPEHSHECVTGFQCSGSEAHLGNCSSPQTLNCSSTQQLSITCLDSSLALHDGQVRLSGERQCEGEVEVFIHQVWRRVLLDSWSLTESSVVCRQLGCGSVLNFNGSSSSSPEHSHECVMGFQCSGSEAHLGNCSSPQTLNCSSTQQLSITCLALSKRRHRTTTEAVYEEIQHKPTNRHSLFTQREEQQITPENYDDVITVGLRHHGTGDLPENYDDVVIIRQFSNDKADLPDLSVSTTPATTTSASPPALSKRRHRTTPEAIYEGIQHRHNHFTQRGSLMSEELHSGYEDADELLSGASFFSVFQGAEEKLVLTNRQCDEQKKMEGCLTLILLSSVIIITTSETEQRPV